MSGKNPQKNTEKSQKVPKMDSHRGVPGWTSNVVFEYFWAPGPPWGPPWLPDLAPEPPGPLETWIFGDFWHIFRGFWEDSGSPGVLRTVFFGYFK